jgi:hypothetical protein
MYIIYILYININHTPGRGLTIFLNIHMQKSTSIQLSLQSIYTNYAQSREYSPLLRITVLLSNVSPLLRSTVFLYDTLLLYQIPYIISIF